MFEVGIHAATFIRTGYYSFAVYPRGFAGSHTLELVDRHDVFEIFQAYLDGIPFRTDGCAGLWDLLTDLSIGESRFVDDEDA